jgi:hypothetical protein
VGNINVKYFVGGGLEHNWEVYQDGFLIGYVHCNGDGEDFGGSLGGGVEKDSLWDAVQELCYSDLADLYLIDRMEEMGY